MIADTAAHSLRDENVKRFYVDLVRCSHLVMRDCKQQETSYMLTKLTFNPKLSMLETTRWRRGVAVERRIRDREVAGSGLGRALRRKNSGQVSHTYG